MKALLERVRAALEQLWDCTCGPTENEKCERCSTLSELDEEIARIENSVALVDPLDQIDR